MKLLFVQVVYFSGSIFVDIAVDTHPSIMIKYKVIKFYL